MSGYSSSRAPSRSTIEASVRSSWRERAAGVRLPDQPGRDDIRERVEHRLDQRLRALGVGERVALGCQVALERRALGARDEEGMAAGTLVCGVPLGRGHDALGDAAGRRLVVARDQELAELLQAQPRGHADHDLSRNAGAEAPDQLPGRRGARQRVAARLELRGGALVVEQEQEGPCVGEHARVDGELGDAAGSGSLRHHELALAHGGTHGDRGRSGPFVERGGGRFRRPVEQHAGADADQARVEQERREHERERITRSHCRLSRRPLQKGRGVRPGSAAGSSPPRCRPKAASAGRLASRSCAVPPPPPRS